MKSVKLIAVCSIVAASLASSAAVPYKLGIAAVAHNIGELNIARALKLDV